MTKFFNAEVELFHQKTVPVQVAADTDAEAIEMAKQAAVAKEPQFTAGNVDLKLVGETTLTVGSRVHHRLFGGGVVENLQPASNRDFIFTIKFDKKGAMDVLGPREVLRPEEMADHDPRNLPHYRVGFGWKRKPDTLEVVGKAMNTKERIDPTVFDVLKWCFEHAPLECKPRFVITQQVTINDDSTGVHHNPMVTYDATLAFMNEEALNRFLLMFTD